MEKIIQLRSEVYDNMSLESKIKTNERLTKNIEKVLILAESYPELETSENFRH